MGRAFQLCEGKILISVCCICGHVRDDMHAGGSWVDVESFLAKYEMRDEDVVFSHTYCPECFARCRRTCDPGFDAAVLNEIATLR